MMIPRKVIPLSSRRTIIAVIAMPSLPASGDARCRWASRGGVGSEWGPIDSVGDPRDSAWNRRDGFGLHHQIGRNTGRSGRLRIDRECFRFWDNSPGHLPPAHAAGIRGGTGAPATREPRAAGRIRCAGDWLHNPGRCVALREYAIRGAFRRGARSARCV